MCNMANDYFRIIHHSTGNLNKTNNSLELCHNNKSDKNVHHIKISIFITDIDITVLVTDSITVKRITNLKLAKCKSSRPIINNKSGF